jgi:hypothetical protein
MVRWGVDPEWHAHTKRVPAAVWSAPLFQRKSFLLGLLDADGTLANDPPALHMCNRELLRDVQLLFRTVGIASRLRGPYNADHRGHQSWRLSINGSLLRHRLNYGVAPNRQRFGRDDLLTPRAAERFLDAFPRNPFRAHTKEQGSFYVLWNRLRHKGYTNPHTLHRMYRALDTRDDELYATATVRSVRPLEEEACMYTLSVPHELHRYNSAGVISKNSSAASLVDAATVELHACLPSADPSAFIFAQVHDAIYVEASVEHSQAVADLMARVLPCEIQVKPGAPWMPLTAEPTIATNWKEAT